jgi:hypothetical protein
LPPVGYPADGGVHSRIEYFYKEKRIMKRIAVALLLCMILPLGAFALDFYAGVNVNYASLIRPADVVLIDTEGLNIADFAFGGEVRIIAGSFWASSVGTYTPGDINLPHRIDFLLDGGLALSLGIVRAGIGIGPNFGFEFSDSTTRLFRTGANMRMTGDVVLGPALLGLSWISRIDFTRASIVDAFMNPYGQLGVSLLFGI